MGVRCIEIRAWGIDILNAMGPPNLHFKRFLWSGQ